MFVFSPHHADISLLDAGGIELGAGLRYIGLRSGSSFEAILRQLKSFGVSFDGFDEEFRLRVGAAQFEIIDGEFGVQTQAGVF